MKSNPFSFVVKQILEASRTASAAGIAFAAGNGFAQSSTAGAFAYSRAVRFNSSF